MRKFLSELKSYIIIILVVVLFRSFIATPAIVNMDSMVDTLNDHDVIIINKIYLKLNDVKRFDIVVLNNDSEGDKIIKRVIGLPNEKIEYKDNNLYINDKLVKTNLNFPDTDDFVAYTGDDEYFVLGDNRSVSKDSRVLGNFKYEDIIGTVDLRIYPLDKIGFVE